MIPWDPEKGILDENHLRGFDSVVHLAGESISGGRWTEARKRTILESRTKGTSLMCERLNRLEPKDRPHSFVAASAIGYYGNRGEEMLTEASPPGTGFLADTARLWEEESGKVADLDIRTVIIRTGIVLSMDGGALPRLLDPIRFFTGAPLGSGGQYLSWIHIDDLCGIYMKGIEDGSMNGVYNGVAPVPITNAQFVKTAAEILKRPLLLPNVPAFVLKALLGEMSALVLDGTKVSSKKIEQAGYTFHYETLEKALRDLIEKTYA
jgi:hypothetical protein